MILKGGTPTHRTAIVSLRCPSCRQVGTFDGVIQFDAQTAVPFASGASHLYVSGLRSCPNPACKALVYCILNTSENNKLVASYPPERLDFDATNIPAAITKALEEAITCHATECFIASAIMVRKTLEELCHDRGATGGNLKERIRALGTKVLLPQELLNGLDDLRLL